MARELQDALALFSNRSQALMRGDVNPSIRQQAREMSWESTRAMRLVRNILLYTQQQGLSMELVNLRDLLAGLVRKYSYTSPMARSSTTEIELIESAEASDIVGDPKLLETVFDNLLENAREAGVRAKGHVNIKVALIKVNGKVTVTISDDGPGILADNLDQIFLPFFTTASTDEAGA